MQLARATEILPSGAWPAEAFADRIALTYDDRHRRRKRYTAAGGTAFLLDLHRATVLRAGDALRLTDGRLIRVDAAPEALLEVRAADARSLLRLAWHIGNRHLPARLEADRILIREDAVIAAMLHGLGASVLATCAPFTPEPGAYGTQPRDGAAAHEHEHPHVHAHGHGPGQWPGHEHAAHPAFRDGSPHVGEEER
jgi:urease accessory protein